MQNAVIKFKILSVTLLLAFVSPARGSLHDNLVRVARKASFEKQRHLLPANFARWTTEDQAARRHAIDHALDALETLLDRVEADHTFVQLEIEGRHRVGVYNGPRFPREDYWAFHGYNVMVKRFEAVYQKDFDDVAYALALRYPKDVDVAITSETLIPHYFFKKDSPLANILAWNSLPPVVQEHMLIHQAQGGRMRFEPYVATARQKLRELRRRDTVDQLCGRKFL